jgi:hypothetical protein
MPFVALPGVKGKVFTPDKICREGGQKHPCEDCFSCQMCGDDRCQICRDRNGGRRRKLERKERH